MNTTTGRPCPLDCPRKGDKDGQRCSHVDCQNRRPQTTFCPSESSVTKYNSMGGGCYQTRPIFRSE